VPDDWPLIPTILFLFVVAFARAGTTYAIARGLRGASDRRSSLLSRPMVQRAEETVRRYGAPAVALSFLTVGIQTAINAAAGALKMPLARYLPALAFGALVWGVLYATVGMAVVLSVLGNGWALVGVVTVLGAVALMTRLARRRWLDESTRDDLTAVEVTPED
jgi:membrane protein DedA with SNARE-associated domain